MTQTFPLPITALMLTPANPNYDRPRYTGAGAATDWSMGATGNEADIATLSTPVADKSSSASVTPYPIRTQTAKGAAMVPSRVIEGDIGKDYGTYAGAAGRTGTITPRAPYPAVKP